MHLIQHFGSDFFASLHVAKLIQFFFNFSLTIYFYQLYLQGCATSTRGLRKGGLMCKLGALYFYSSSVQVDSFVLRNSPERKARKRCPAMPPLRFGTAGQREGDSISCCACAFANASALRTTRDLRKF